MKTKSLSIKELAAVIGVSTDTIRRAVRKGEIPATRVRTALRFDLHQVLTCMRRNAEARFGTRTQRLTQTVRLTYSIGPCGGKRPWFVCHGCQRRVGVLYYATERPFRCRICCDLAYPSQYVSRDQSYGRQHRCLSFSEKSRLRVQDAT